MGALPTFVPLMKAQSRRISVPNIDDAIKPFSAEHYAERRSRLGIVNGPRVVMTSVPGVHYEYRGRHNHRKREFLIVERKGSEVAIEFPGEATPSLVPHWRTVIKEVSQKHGVQPHQIRSRSRFAPLVEARHEVCFRLHQETPLSLQQIATKIGYCDHSVVAHAIRKHEERLEAMNAQ